MPGSCVPVSALSGADAPARLMTPSRGDLARTLGRSNASSSSAPLSIWATRAFWSDAAVEGVLPLIAAAVGAHGWEGVPEDVRADALRCTHEEAARAELRSEERRVGKERRASGG